MHIDLINGRYRFRDDNNNPIDPAPGCAPLSAWELTCSAAGITALNINAKDGDDAIYVDADSSIPTTIRAGSGNDRVSGSHGPDTVYGGYGNDSITGSVGNDILADREGGNDKDTISGSSGNDRIYVRDGDALDRALCSTGTGEYYFGDSADYMSGCELIIR